MASPLPQIPELSRGDDQILQPFQDRVEAGRASELGRTVLEAGALGQWALGAGIAETLLRGGELRQAGKGLGRQ